MTLGDIIKEYREEHGLSMHDFAKLSGLSKGYISMLESNRNPRSGLPIAPSIQCIKRAADGMRMDFNVLFERIDSDVNLSPADLADCFQIPLLAKYVPGEDAEENAIGSIGVTQNMAKEGGYFAVYVPDGALAPSVNEDDIAVVHMQDRVESDDIAVVSIDKQPGVCRIITNTDKGIIVSSLRIHRPPEMFFGKDAGRVQIAGRVCEARRRF